MSAHAASPVRRMSMAYPRIARGPILVEESPHGLRRWSTARRRAGQSIGLVPTMGALHEGHLNLVSELSKVVDRVVVSIFVNPTQFGPNEDFAKYPRTETEDIKALEAAGCDIAYIPSIEEMYDKDMTTTVQVGSITEELCGAFRPGHFDGV